MPPEHAAVSRGAVTPDRAPGESVLAWAFVALLAVATCGDTLRMGFYFDDFLLLDAARRMPLGGLLLGQFGIRPWYRPLSRELYFLLVVAAGPLGLLVARSLSLVALAFLLRGVQALGGRLFGSRAGVAACALVASHGIVKFLVGWASGFQDLLALALTVWAVLEHARGRRVVSAVLAGLAPF